MPVRRSGRRMRARKVMVLVTGAALNRIAPLPSGSAANLHCVLVAIVSLAGEVSSGMAIHAARMAQDGHKSLKSSSSIVLRSGTECQQECGYKVCGVSHLHAFRSATPTRSGVKGNSLSRRPVALKMALPIAAGVTVIAVSPAPIAGTPAGDTKTLSIAGIS